MSTEAVATRDKITQNQQKPLTQQNSKQITIPLSFESAPAVPEAEAVVEPETQAKTPEWVSVKVKRGDALTSIFQRQGLNQRDLHDIMTLGRKTARLKSLQPGDVFKFQVDENNRLQALIYEISPLKSLHVRRQNESFVAENVLQNIEKRTAYASGRIDSSLFEAGKNANLRDALIMELVNVFAWDIDFALDIREGDQFSLLYEEQFLNGEKINDGPILAAEFINQGRVYRTVRFADADGRSDYYTPDGHSMRKAFLRTPVDFRRISSRFGNRHHPVLNRMRLHKGVDYAARTGTPIKAAGDGKIVYRGYKGGYGRTVIIQHGGRYSTLYAHMSRFKKSMGVGKRVKQGQIIGYVGRSGRATGSHLHYEFRVNGVHRNPLTVRLPNAAPIKARYQDAFTRLAAGMLAQLDMHKQTRLAMHQ